MISLPIKWVSLSVTGDTIRPKIVMLFSLRALWRDFHVICVIFCKGACLVVKINFLITHRNFLSC